MYGKLTLAIAMLLSAPAAFAQYYAYDSAPIRSDAVPGEYFFNLGVSAINHGDYKHAVEMYKVAASWGFKPAEYNLGVIFAKGEGGVPVDLPQAYAWLQLASERNDSRYVVSRLRVQSALTPEQTAESEKILADLHGVYADEVALPRAKAQWRDVLTHATGSNVGYTGSNMKVGSAGDTRSNPTQIVKPKPVRGFTGGSANVDAMDVAGGNTADGSIAYSDLRATDNPYDPPFNGVVTVGAVKPSDRKTVEKPASESHPAN